MTTSTTRSVFDARGWVTIAAVFATLSLSAGLSFYSLSAFGKYLGEVRGIGIGFTSGASTLLLLTSGFVGVVIVKGIGRHGPSVYMAIGGVVMGVGISLISVVHETWELFLVYALFGIGLAGVSTVPASIVITRRFPIAPERPLAVALTGTATGGAVVAPFVAEWLDRAGLAYVAPRLGIAIGLTIVALVLLFIRPKPSAVAAESRASQRPADCGRRQVALGLARTWPFVGVSLAFTLLFVVQGAVITHTLTIAGERGVSDAGVLLTAIATTSVVARVVTLPLMGRINPYIIAFTTAVLQIAAMADLAYANVPGVLLAGAGLLGVGAGINTVLLPVCIHVTFAGPHYGFLLARANFAILIGAATGPLILGVGRDFAGSYTAPLALLGLGSIAATILFVVLLRWNSRRSLETGGAIGRGIQA